MASAKISDLASLSTPDIADLVVVVDVSDTTMAASGTNKKTTAGGIRSLVASTANTFTAQQVFETGSSGGSPAVFRKTGGTAGTDEVQVSHDGTSGKVESKDGLLELRAAGSSGASRRIAGGSASGQYKGAFSGAAFWVEDFYTMLMNASGLFVGDQREIKFASVPLDDPDSTSFSFKWGLDAPTSGVARFSVSGNNSCAISTPARSPSSLSASQNDYAPVVARFYRLTASTPVNITGLSISQVDGQECHVWNVGSSTITLKHQDAGSAAANRWLSTTGADVALAANQCAFAVYDSASSRWRVAPL